MPQGLQVWDASGTLIIDTSTYVLKEIISATVAATTTTTQFVSTAIPANATVLATTVAPSGTASASFYLPDVQIDVANSRIQYRFLTADSGTARLSSLAF